MGNNVGLDFGTTYSILAMAKDPDAGDYAPRAVSLDAQEQREPFYDSLVLIDEGGTPRYDLDARKNVGRKGTKAYKGFKLMLDESKETVPSLYSQNHYDDTITPNSIVEKYLTYLISTFVASHGKIDRLVVGIPEIWRETDTKHDTLRDILLRLKDSTGNKLVESVDVLSEPVAACSYYVENYRKTTGKTYKGHVLIVDYGGGTLDIALCDVQYDGNTPDITVLKRAGAGANEDKEVGKAGLAFMEKAVRLSLYDSGVTEKLLEENKNKFHKIVYEFEDALKSFKLKMDEWKRLSEDDKARIRKNSRNKEDREKDSEYKTYSPVIKFLNAFEVADLEMLSDNDTPFFIPDEEIFRDSEGKVSIVESPITFGHIAQAYDEEISGPLSDELGEIIRYMDKHGINYGPQAQNFKIQLIGGFCNFYLVEKHVYNKLHRNVTVRQYDDARFQGELANSIERTMAVAYGTALYANEQVTYGTNAQYTLGLAGEINGTECTLWSLPLGEKLMLDKPYLFKFPNGRTTTIGVEDNITEFMYRYDEDDPTGVAIPLDDKYVEQLQMDPDRRYLIGISQDRNRCVTVHCWDVTSANLRGLYGKVEQLIWDGKLVTGMIEKRSVYIGHILRARKKKTNGKVVFLSRGE